MSAPAGQDPKGQAPDLRVLVVDDEEAFRDFARDAALTQGWTVETASDGETCRALYARFAPDVVVLDIIMPDEDGIELLRWMAGEGAPERVIMVTGFNPHYGEMAEALGEALGLSEIVVLNKPLRLAALLAAIRGG